MTQNDEAREFVRSLDDDDLVAAAREEEMWRFVGKGSGHTAGRRFVVEEARKECERRRERRESQRRATARQTASRGQRLAKLGIGAAAVLAAASTVGPSENSR